MTLADLQAIASTNPAYGLYNSTKKDTGLKDIDGVTVVFEFIHVSPPKRYKLIQSPVETSANVFNCILEDLDYVAQ